MPRTVNPEEKEELKEGDVPPQGLEYLMSSGDANSTHTIITDDKLSLFEAGIIEQRTKLEIEIVIKIALDVQGKGKDYAANLEVFPDAQIL